MQDRFRIQSIVRSVSYNDEGLTKIFTRQFPSYFIEILLLIVVLCSLALALLAPNGLLNGDAAVYAQQIESVSLRWRTIHLGYYLIGIVFTKLTPFSTDLALNLLNNLLGGMSLGLIFVLGYQLTGKIQAGIASVLILFSYYYFVFNAAFAEVYAPQLFFILASFLAVIWGKPIIAGISFAIAFLITPSTILVLPFLLLLRLERKFILVMSGVIVLIAAVALIPNWKDYLWGGRGFLVMTQTGLGIIKAIKKEIREVMGFSIFLVFIVIGLWKTIADRETRKLALLIVFIWFIHLIFGEKFIDVPVQLPVYALLAVFGGIGYSKIEDFSKFLRYPLMLLFFGGFLFVGSQTFSSLDNTSSEIDHYRDRVFEIRDEEESEFIVIGGWEKGILYEHYLYRTSYTGNWVNTEWLVGKWGEQYFDDGIDSLQQAQTDGRKIILLEEIGPSVYATLKDNGIDTSSFEAVSGN